MQKYIYIICPVVTLIICQLIKFTIESVKYKKFNWGRLFNGAGGMPSTHTSFSSSLTMFVGFTLGFDNPIFAVAFVFTCIISYDAMGLRFESGKQAEAINMIVDQVFKTKAKKTFKRLKEQLGHKPLEVLMGYVLGTIMAFIFYKFLY